jgi:hypothetical protein
VKLVLAGFVALAIGAGTATASFSPPKWSDCGHLTVKPVNIVITCADANYQLRGLAWTSWGASTVQGTGTAHINDCTPTCSNGKERTYPVETTLAKLTKCGSSSRYLRLTIVFPSAAPKGHSKKDVINLTCKF